MTLRLNRVQTANDLAVLRPVIFEYFQFISSELARHHHVDLAPESPVDAMFANPDRFFAAHWPDTLCRG